MAIYKKDKEGRIWIYRNKRKPLFVVRENYKNEDGCINCALFNVCLTFHVVEENVSICFDLIKKGIISQENEFELFFTKVET